MENYKDKTNKYFDLEIKCSNGSLYYIKYTLDFNSLYFNKLFLENFKEKNINSVNLTLFSTEVVGMYLLLLDTKKTNHIDHENLINILKLIDFTESNVVDLLLKNIYLYIRNCINNEALQLDNMLVILQTLHNLINKKQPTPYSGKKFIKIRSTLSTYYTSNSDKFNEILNNMENSKIIHIITDNMYYYRKAYNTWVQIETNFTFENVLYLLSDDYIKYTLIGCGNVNKYDCIKEISNICTKYIESQNTKNHKKNKEIDIINTKFLKWVSYVTDKVQ